MGFDLTGINVIFQSPLLVTDPLLHQDGDNDGGEKGSSPGEGLPLALVLGRQKEEHAVGEDHQREQQDTPLRGEQEDQRGSNKPRNEARDDVSHSFKFVMVLESIECGDDDRDDAPEVEDDRDTPSQQVRQAVTI